MGTEVTQGYVINNVYCEYKKAVENFDNYCLNGTAGGSGHKGNGNATIASPARRLPTFPKDAALVQAIPPTNRATM